VIFSRTPQEGTFPLDLAHIDTTNAPDLVVSFRWSAIKTTSAHREWLLARTEKKGKARTLP